MKRNDCELENCSSRDVRALSHCFRCKRFACLDCYDQFVATRVDKTQSRHRVCTECLDELRFERTEKIAKLKGSIVDEKARIAEKEAQQMPLKEEIYCLMSRVRDTEKLLVLTENAKFSLEFQIEFHEERIEKITKKIALLEELNEETDESDAKPSPPPADSTTKKRRLW